MKAIKQLFFLPSISLFVVILIATIRPAAIFGGIHYGGILGIYIPVIVIMVGAIIWFYYIEYFSDYYERSKPVHIIYFISTLLSYLITLTLLIVCISTLSSRNIYIASARELNVIGRIPNAGEANYYLEDDIDFNGKGPSCFGKIARFRGKIDGNGFSIKNINLQTSDSFDGNFGLVGANYGDISNISFQSCNIVISNNSSDYFGFIAGVNYGTISNCRISNSRLKLDAKKRDDVIIGVGGIVGHNDEGNISNCEYSNIESQIEETIYVKANFDAAGFGTCALAVGGIVGFMDGGAVNECIVYGAKIETEVSYQAGFMSVDPYLTTGGLIGNMMSNSAVNSCLSFAELKASKTREFLLGGSALDSDRKYEGIFVARYVSGTFNDCYSGSGDCWVIGNNNDGTNGVMQLSSNIISKDDLPESYSIWVDTDYGFPTPFISANYGKHISSIIGVWIVFALLGLGVLAVGLINYIMIIKRGNK